MLQSPNNVVIRANNGNGRVEIHGQTIISRAEIGTLISPVISNIQTQVSDLQKTIRTLTPSTTPSQPTNVSNSNSNSNTNQQNNAQIQIINARLNTLQDEIKSLEERLNMFVISVDKRLSSGLSSSTSTSTSTSMETSVETSSVETSVETSSMETSVETSSVETSVETPGETSSNNITRVVLKRTPSGLNNKIIRYAW
jgi:hypothetical protein